MCFGELSLADAKDDKIKTSTLNLRIAFKGINVDRQEELAKGNVRRTVPEHFCFNAITVRETRESFQENKPNF